MACFKLFGQLGMEHFAHGPAHVVFAFHEKQIFARGPDAEVSAFGAYFERDIVDDSMSALR